MLKKLCILLSLFIFVSCATLTPVVGGKSRTEYKRMITNNDPQVPCYMKGFRGGALVWDIILGIFPILIDAATGAFHYYYFDPSPSNPQYMACIHPERAYQQVPEYPAPLAYPQEQQKTYPRPIERNARNTQTYPPPQAYQQPQTQPQPQPIQRPQNINEPPPQKVKPQKKKAKNTIDVEDWDIEEW